MSPAKSTTKNRNNVSKTRRAGTVAVLAALMMAFLMVLVACAVDLGYVCLVRGQLQRAADASALAGVGALHRPAPSLEVLEYRWPISVDDARRTARQFARANGAGALRPNGNSYLDVNLNWANEPTGDVLLGRLRDLGNLQEPLTVTEQNPNSVRVRIPLTEGHKNGPISLFFARTLGIDHVNAEATATATIVDAPTMLPIATSLPHWNSLASGQDSYAFEDGEVVSGPDEVPELVVYPGRWNGVDMPPGNFGTVLIGGNGGTSNLREQIALGPTINDFDYHGGALHAGMELSGETGVSAGMETAFVGGKADGTTYPGIIGETRFMPIYSGASGNGRNARFLIEKFVAVRIMAAHLKTGTKRIVVQPVVDLNELHAKILLTR